MRANQKSAAEGAKQTHTPTRARSKAKRFLDRTSEAALQRFVNLQDTPQAIDDFERDHRGFLPSNFFTSPFPSEEGHGPQQLLWTAYQVQLKGAWRLHFPAKLVGELLDLEIPEKNPESVIWQLPDVPIDPGVEFQPVFGCQRAIVSLASARWRAKVCRSCRSPFVADKPNRQFCNGSVPGCPRALRRSLNRTERS